jgi:hypothetical protein
MSKTPAELTEAEPMRPASLAPLSSDNGLPALFPSYFAFSTQIPVRPSPSRLRETTR